MSQKSQRSMVTEARRAARDAQSKRREAARIREKRIEDLAITVMVAVAERDQVVEQVERRAGEALQEMTGGEGLSIREAVEWCGEALDEREATRLRRIVQTEHRQPVVAAEQPREPVATTL